MGRRVISAMDYGFRKVIRVVVDDSIPQWIHPEDGGQPHAPGLAREVSPGGVPFEGERGALNRSLAGGTECYACKQNWIVEEYIFEQGALIMSDQDMLDRVTALLDQKYATVPIPMVDLNDRPI